MRRHESRVVKEITIARSCSGGHLWILQSRTSELTDYMWKTGNIVHSTQKVSHKNVYKSLDCKDELVVEGTLQRKLSKSWHLVKKKNQSLALWCCSKPEFIMKIHKQMRKQTIFNKRQLKQKIGKSNLSKH